MEMITVVSFYIDRDAMRIVAVMSNGFRQGWGHQKTERGLKSCLNKYAKKHGFVVTGETAQKPVIE